MPPFKYSAPLHRLLSANLRGLHSSPSKLLSGQHQPRSLEEAGPLACRLKSRSVIRFRGPDTFKFLQGLLTNDVRLLAQSPNDTSGDHTTSSYLITPNVPFHSSRPVYAALLTPQGRFLYDLFLYRAPRSNEKLDRTGSGAGPDDLAEDVPAVFADVDAAALDELLDCFRKYRLRSRIEIENLAEDFNCWQRFGGNLSTNTSSVQEPEAASIGWGKGVDHAGESAAQGNNLGWQWFKDPRLDCLGFRGIFSSDIVPPFVESDKEADELHYLLWRLERGVAEGSSEIPKGEAIPLEYNLVGLNAISFDKGCYVGQELVARTHHRGVIRKRLLPFMFVDYSGKEVEQKVSPGSEIVDNTSRKKIGTVTTVLGSRGMGLVKLEEALKQSAELSIKDNSDVRIKVIKPDWWPAEWVQVHEQQSAAA